MLACPSTSTPWPQRHPGGTAAPRRVLLAAAASRSKRRGAGAKAEGADEAAEAAELVHSLLRRTAGGKERLVAVLDRNVRVIRTEHCFLLFEELGRRDAWLQCLEVRAVCLMFLFSSELPLSLFFFFFFEIFLALGVETGCFARTLVRIGDLSCESRANVSITLRIKGSEFLKILLQTCIAFSFCRI
jgi:hypothetical protein